MILSTLKGDGDIHMASIKEEIQRLGVQGDYYHPDTEETPALKKVFPVSIAKITSTLIFVLFLIIGGYYLLGMAGGMAGDALYCRAISTQKLLVREMEYRKLEHVGEIEPRSYWKQRYRYGSFHKYAVHDVTYKGVHYDKLYLYYEVDTDYSVWELSIEIPEEGE